MYDSPITLISTEINHQITEKHDQMIMEAVWKAGVDIDKDKLIAAINQDRERYEAAYNRGFLAGLSSAKESEDDE